MSTYKFSANQCFAVFSTHGEKCYLCGTPIDLKTMEVDHILPESLLRKPKELQAALNAFGLSPNFDINSFANWLPACRPCNGTKKDIVFKSTPIIQVYLQDAIAKAPDAKELAEKTVKKREIAKALNTLERAEEDGMLDAETIDILGKTISQNRPPDLEGKPIRITPLYEILSEQNGIQSVRGPYGVGGRPVIVHPDTSFSCPNCGSGAAWNGSRCVICGEMSDE